MLNINSLLNINSKFLGLVAKSCLTLATLRTEEPGRLQSMGFSRQEHWRGLPSLSPGDLPNPGIEPGLLPCRRILYQLSIREAFVTSLEHGKTIMRKKLCKDTNRALITSPVHLSTISQSCKPVCSSLISKIKKEITMWKYFRILTDVQIRLWSFSSLMQSQPLESNLGNS